MLNKETKMIGSEYALTDVMVRETAEVCYVKDPAFTSGAWQASQNEFALEVEGVGSFYAREGKLVEYSSLPGADPEWVRLYLNGQVLVALLHQRKIINFHASSFVYNGIGVMVPGETGAGKSSVTLSFALHGGGFLTDDLTPVVFEGEQPCIMPLKRWVKIRKETAEELGIGPDAIFEAESGTGKKYVSLAPVQANPFPLKVIVKIETGPVERPVFSESSPAEKFSLLRSEVCSWEILAGMPETEADYLQQLVKTVEQVWFVRVIRPERIGIAGLHEAVKQYLDKIKDESKK